MGSYTKTTGTSTSLSLSAIASAPPPFSGIGVSRSISTTVSSSESHTSSHSETLTATRKTDISIPANTTLYYQTVLFQVEYTADWRGRYCFHEDGKIWCEISVKGHHEWFVPLSNVFGSCV